MTDYHASYDYDDEMWAAGWMIGKYNESARVPTADDNQYLLDSWFEGFTKGAVEVGEYNRLRQYMHECLSDHAEAQALIIERYFNDVL